MKKLHFKLMYLLLFIISLGSSVVAFAQEEENTDIETMELDEVTPNEMIIRPFDFPATAGIKTFQPFDYPNQNKSLGKDTDIKPARLNNWIIGGVIGLGLLALFIFLLIKIKKLFPRILIAILGLLILLAVAYLFLLLDAYAQMNPPVAKGKAQDRLIALSKELGMEWLGIMCVEDDNYRLGIIYNRKELVLVDYETNKGWLVPKGQIASIIAFPDSTMKQDAQTVTIYSKDSEASMTPLQHLAFVLKEGNNLSQIRLRYKDENSNYDAIVMIENYILAWESN